MQTVPSSSSNSAPAYRTMPARPPSLEQCLLGEDSAWIQRQLHQHNYLHWFQSTESTLERQPSENSLSSQSSGHALERSSKELQEVDLLDHLESLNVNEKSDPKHGSRNNHNASTNSFDLLEEFAPVSSKWSDCVPQTSDDEDEKDALERHLINGPHQIDLSLLRKIVSTGCGMDDDDEDEDNDIAGCMDPNAAANSSKKKKGCRALAWRVLLGYLPTDTSQWLLERKAPNDSKCTLQQQREMYISLATDVFTNVSDITIASLANELRGRPASGARRRVKRSTSKNTSENSDSSPTVIPSFVQRYWEENALDTDVLQRSLSGCSTEFNTLLIDEKQFLVQNYHTSDSDHESLDSTKMKDLVENVLLLDEIHKDVVRTHPDLAFFLDPYQNVGKRRYAALERILFVWAKCNESVRYVQGMNEIVGILYYVLANDLNDEWAIWAEADTYWLLNSLLGEMRDVFISGFDHQDTGIQGRLVAMKTLLHRHDPEVAEHLQDLGIEISFFAIRWWTTLLCREFLLPDTIRLWDSMFASTHKDNFLRYVCVIMVMSLRDRLLKGDFTTCLQLLHSFPPTSIERLLQASRALWIYESQISVACHRGGLTLHQALTTIESPKALIMGFGFLNGTPPTSMVNNEEAVNETKGATTNIEATVRRSASELFGRAKGWYSRYNFKDQPGKDCSAKVASAASKDVNSDIAANEDDVYLQAISNTGY